ncbi:SHOCT domain-containing protein [Streptomyces chattanoogensis]|uniref:SHOCT domain-containing protein n=1 Tax=Streptomyces chattanoogensis TaxID=66876 RepID=UPI0036C3C663
MMWYDGGWGGGGWFFMAVVMVLFWALIIAGVVALVRYVSGSHRGQPGGTPSSHEAGGGNGRAEDLLSERFARGEIDEDEYKRRMTLLREHR